MIRKDNLEVSREKMIRKFVFIHTPPPPPLSLSIFRAIFLLLACVTLILFDCKKSDPTSPRPDPNIEIVKMASNNLQIDLRGQNANGIISNIGLTNMGAGGVMVSWMSSKTNFIATDGMVTRPDFTNGDQSVVLTATLYKGAVTNTKTFSLTVLALPDPNIADVQQASNSLQIELRGQVTNRIISDIGLTNLAADGVMVSWGSSDADIITTNGMVTRPALGRSNAQVTLTASLYKGAVTNTKAFTLTVPAELPTDEQAVEMASNALQLDLHGQATNAVTNDIGLTNLGAHGVMISWSSSNADFIATKRQGHPSI